jgi:Fur family zinc uptake transcriptional regulator
MGEGCHHHHSDGPPGSPRSPAPSRGGPPADRRGRADDAGAAAGARTAAGAGEPVKAYDLIARFGEDGQPAKPPTVYRALEFLERKGLAHRIASISAYVACTSGSVDHAAAFLICDCCGATTEVSAPVADELGRAADAAGYVIVRTTIEAHGRCPACRSAA